MNTNRAEYLPHEGVMLEEISSIIKDVPTGNFVDATYGFGSHFNLSTIHDHLNFIGFDRDLDSCLLYTSPSPRDRQKSRMPSSA